MSYDRAEVASRAGVAPEYIDRLVEMSILDAAPAGTFSTGDLRRVALVQTLENAGLPLDEIGGAIRDGHLTLSFMDASSYDRFSTFTDSTFAEVSERTGIPLDLLGVVREAIGFARPDPDDRVRDNEMRIVPLVEMHVAQGFRPTTIERWLRVYGESMRRIAETEADWWHTEVEQRLADSGLSPSEVMAISDVDIAEPMAPLLDDAIVGIYHGQQEHAWTSSIISGVEGALAAAGVFSRIERPPAICFLDLTGYTRLTEEHGDMRAAEIADDLARLVRRSSAAHEGTPIKWLGDGVMFYFRHPASGVEAALEMVDEVVRTGLPPAHVGMHAGPVLFSAGDYFGQTVNVASRIADYARPGEVLVSKSVVEACDSFAGFNDVGEVELKGVSGTVHLYSALRLAWNPPS